MKIGRKQVVDIIIYILAGAVLGELIVAGIAVISRVLTGQG